MDLLLALPLLALVTVVCLTRRRLSVVRTYLESTVHLRLRRLWTVLREFNATQLELVERQALLDRPWEEDFMHWAHDGQSWHLHGHLVPPHDGRRRGATPEGWCPANRRPSLGAAHRQQAPARPTGPPAGQPVVNDPPTGRAA